MLACAAGLCAHGPMCPGRSIPMTTALPQHQWQACCGCHQPKGSHRNFACSTLKVAERERVRVTVGRQYDPRPYGNNLSQRHAHTSIKLPATMRMAEKLAVFSLLVRAEVHAASNTYMASGYDYWYAVDHINPHCCIVCTTSSVMPPESPSYQVRLISTESVLLEISRAAALSSCRSPHELDS